MEVDGGAAAAASAGPGAAAGKKAKAAAVAGKKKKTGADAMMEEDEEEEARTCLRLESRDVMNAMPAVDSHSCLFLRTNLQTWRPRCGGPAWTS